MSADLIDGLVSSLMEFAEACRYADWPGRLAHLGRPGLYAWWADAEAAALISARLGQRIPDGIVYVGQAGALKGGKEPDATLGSRLGGNHINGKIRNSTFRLTMSAVLLEEVRPYIVRDRAIGAAGESTVSDWLARHFRVTTVPFDDRSRLAAVEGLVLARVDPPLNLRGMDSTAARQALTERRGVLRGGTQILARPEQPKRSAKIGSHTCETALPCKITLHEEIAEILAVHGNDWLATIQIASLVNQRGRYAKRDGSAVATGQVCLRTRKYAHMFERDGPLVRLIPIAPRP